MREEIGAGTTFFYFSGHLAARSRALFARFCGFAAQSSVRTADVFPVVASLRNLSRKSRMLSQAMLSRTPDKTAMLRRLRKRVMYGRLDLLDHSLLTYINGTQSKYHCRH